MIIIIIIINSLSIYFSIFSTRYTAIENTNMKAQISVKHQYSFRPLILNYDLIAFTLTYLSAEQE